jgi:hypothetical protein
MRKLKLQMQITVDGFVAGPNGEQDWVFISGKQDPEGLQQIVGFGVELAASCDTFLIGRKLAASTFCTYWENVADNQPDNPWHPLAQLIADHRKIAFSSSETTLPAATSKWKTATWLLWCSPSKTNRAKTSLFTAAPILSALSSASTS